MEQNRYATKKKGKTEVYPFWNMADIKNVVEWFENNNEWDGYLITMLELLLGRRIGDTVMMMWSDLYYENGNRKNEIDTIEEQKTGKVTNIPVSNMVWEAVVAILTSKEKPSLPTHVLLKSSEENGLEVDSTIELEQLRTIDKKRIKDRVGKISEYDNNRVLNALKVSMCI